MAPPSSAAAARAVPAGTSRSTRPSAYASAAPHPPAGQDQVEGPGPPGPPGQQLGAPAAGNEAEADLGQRDGRGLGGDDQVAGQGELVAAAQRVALDRGHGRQPDVPDGGEGLDEHGPLGP